MMNIIIADDELLMRIGLKSMINWYEYGWQIVGEAANGKEALELAKQYKPDLIITDIKMPVMDGLELIREIQHVEIECKFIILSCLDEFQYAKEALRLGAVDYLVKSELKQQQLLDALEKVKQLSNQYTIQAGNKVLIEQYRNSIAYLKQSFFKDLFSGFCSAQEIEERTKSLQLEVHQGKLVLIKLRVNQFEDIRQKYVEQDEKLLRYAITNIMEEIIPRKWNKEIIVESSSEYLLIMNLDEQLQQLPKELLNACFEKIEVAMKDFLNLSLSIGVSGMTLSFIELRQAYKEADAALEQHFFERSQRVLYADSCRKISNENTQTSTLTGEEESIFRSLVETDEQEAVDFLNKLKQQLYYGKALENDIRKVYIRIIALTSSCFPIVPEFVVDGRTPYEQILKEERLESLHEVAIRFMQHCQQHNTSNQLGPQSYTEQARSIIVDSYAEDISLQSVAAIINVNPSYLSRVFKQESGETFISFLTRIRMDNAQRLLKNKHVKIYEVASSVGYPNTAYFSKLFKKLIGYSPEDYRNLAQETT